MDNLKILLVEDNLDHQDLISWTLKEHFPQIEVSVVELGIECIKICEDIKFDLILLDYQLPDINGIAVLETLFNKGNDTPIIILTGMGNEGIAVNALKLGAYDYINKTGNYFNTLPVVVQKNIEKHHLRKEKDKLQLVVEEKNVQLEKLSVTDGLTGLYNHRHFFERLLSEVNRSYRYGSPFSCLIVDIDLFKNVNDKWGHLSGDLILREIAKYLKEELRETDIISRYGGDEFAIIMPNTLMNQTMILSERLRKQIEEKSFILKDGIIINLTVSIGIVSFPLETGSSTPEKLVESADLALYKAKLRGRNNICLYNESTSGRSDEDNKEFEEFKNRIGSFSYVIKEKVYISILDFLKEMEKVDPYLFTHSEDVNRYAGMLAKEIGMSKGDLDAIKFASLLHDIGKLGISNKIINKNGKLTEDEFKDIRRHPILSMEILRNIMFFEKEIPLVLYHHENFDGSGYPTGIKGKKIPIGARIIYIADAFAAMTTDRIYQKAMNLSDAKKELLKYSNVRYDPSIVDLFLRIV